MESWHCTTWIGGTLDREVFERATSTGDDEYMMIVTPVGYPSDNRTKVDMELRNTVKGEKDYPNHNFSLKVTFQSLLTVMMTGLKRFDGHRLLPTDSHGV